MSKNPSRTPSVSERRRQEELRQKKARQRNMIIAGSLLALAAIAAVALFLTRNDGGDDTTSTELTGDRPLAAIEPALRDGYYDEPPAMTINTANEYQAVITMEDGGEMRFNLFDDEAPLTVNNFIFLATQGFYDGTTFHRVLADFMAQGGDPTGTGTGGPGYAFEDETGNGLTFDRRGLLAMANTGQPDTNGSQFFITFAPATHLNGAHTIFGELVEGDDALSGISLREPETATEPGDRIAEITIIEQ
jgi:cyclophilin family peptidyl-prolyl cis-trans isomerase